VVTIRQDPTPVSTPALLPLPRPGLLGVDTTLERFAIVTYAVPEERLQRHLHPRFVVDAVTLEGERCGLLSVVPFLDRRFRSAHLPWPRDSFGQTNYRAYVRDNASGERAVWFFGTCLDSWSVVIPRVLWRLPWHRGRIRFDRDRYRMTTDSAWAPATLELADTGGPLEVLPGFPDAESTLLVLTHPLVGYYHRRDGRLGSYSVWHDRMAPTLGRCVQASFPLLERLDLVSAADQARPYSVLLQDRVDFTIYLPPRRLE